ncbi:hypothetical protein TRFO_24556 [Tritrichomonas foetus]|uniref:Ubiquitin-like protease family profile domain-containing protein n=1 Tax=Tritrichomonas foetus TaxID=1144522 RepID=A0A1J4KCY7_9EUKA|nr:hypothetical protein TRFO_24556 [Tritrichomonas foetus]|eukprot:OHT07301.1 hypothetical protein TRFO_24556 [Tritrichomonas foetus]
MIYEEAKEMLLKTTQLEQLPSRFSSNTTTENRSNSDEINFWTNLIQRWLWETETVLININKLTECLTIDRYVPPILEIIRSSSNFSKLSEEKYICKFNLLNLCRQIISQVTGNASCFYDLLKTEKEIGEFIQKRSNVILVLNELSLLPHVRHFHQLGYYFISSRFKSVPKDVSHAVLSAKNFLENTYYEFDPENHEFVSIFLYQIQINEQNIDLTVCQRIISICSNQVKPNRTVFINGNHNNVTNSFNTVNSSSLATINNNSNTNSNTSNNSINGNNNMPLSKSTPNFSGISITFKDVDVTPYDFQSLQGKNWVNDKIIHFHGRLIEMSHNDIFFIPPCTVQYMRFINENIVKSTVSQWNLMDKYSIIFIPFTNSSNLKEIGNHWSLLVWFVQENRFVHCDSLGKTNKTNLKTAMLILKKFIRLFQLKKPFLANGNVPQQSNTYDCGLYVMAFEDYIASNRKIEGMENVITDHEILNMRGSLVKRIQNIGYSRK